MGARRGCDADGAGNVAATLATSRVAHVRTAADVCSGRTTMVPSSSAGIEASAARAMATKWVGCGADMWAAEGMRSWASRGDDCNEPICVVPGVACKVSNVVSPIGSARFDMSAAMAECGGRLMTALLLSAETPSSAASSGAAAESNDVDATALTACDLADVGRDETDVLSGVDAAEAVDEEAVECERDRSTLVAASGSTSSGFGG